MGKPADATEDLNTTTETPITDPAETPATDPAPDSTPGPDTTTDNI